MTERSQPIDKDAVERPETTSIKCTICEATVAAWPKCMVCHCRTVPWEAQPTEQTDDAVVERLRRAVQDGASHEDTWTIRIWKEDAEVLLAKLESRQSAKPAMLIREGAARKDQR